MARNTRKETLNHLHYLYPKLQYVEKALKQKGDTEQAFYQILAAQAILKKIIDPYFNDLLRSHIAVTLNRLIAQSEPGSQTHQTLTGIRSRLYCCQLKELPKILHQIKKCRKNSCN